MQRIALVGTALVLAACAEPDDTTGSRLTQPPAGSPPRTPVDEDDIAIVGQVVAHELLALPEVANAATPPIVQFTGVTSIVKGPIPVDTDPYTDLLRDRLLLLTREKLRFQERTLPQLVIAPPKKSKKKQGAAPTPEVSMEPDYELLAELRGQYKDDLYRIQVQFVDIHTNEVLFDGLYRIRTEASADQSSDQPVDQSGQPPVDSVPPPQAIPDPNPAPPPPTGTPDGSSGVQ
jgi:hypothetical protein